MVGNIILGSFLAYNCSLLALKMKYSDIVDNMKDNILENGLYHFTSEENVDKIIAEGSIRPSGIISSLGSKKTFFFAGIPDLDLLRENIAEFSEQFEWSAIQVKPTEENRKKTPDELENGYIPSDELKQKFSKQQYPMVMARNLMKAYLMKPFHILSKFISSRKNEKLQEPINLDDIDKEDCKENEKDISTNSSFKNDRDKFLSELKFDSTSISFGEYVQDFELDKYKGLQTKNNDLQSKNSNREIESDDRELE